MRISSGGSQNVNLLFSDTAQFRNEDFVVSQAGAFVGRSSAGSVAAQFGHVQLFNPVGSGVTVIMDGFNSSVFTSAPVYVAFDNTELITDDGAWPNKQSGGAAGAAHLRSATDVALLGTRINGVLVSAGIPYMEDFKYPIHLGEGEGVDLVCGTVNITFFGNFWGREV